MARYIELDALVAEIERRVKSLHQVNSPREQAVLYECKDILQFIDTLEVKEIGIDLGDPKGDKSARYIIDTKNLKEKELDLEKEVDVWIEDNGDSNGFFNVQDLAKHFFELGLQAQKGE